MIFLFLLLLPSNSSIWRASAWYADDRGFDPHVRQTFLRGDLVKTKGTAILSFPLIQEGLLSVTGERMCT